MSDCCENKSCAIEAMKVNQSKTLKIVLAINVFLFIVVFSSGLIAQSTGLMSERVGHRVAWVFACSLGVRTEAQAAEMRETRETNAAMRSMAILI